MSLAIVVPGSPAPSVADSQQDLYPFVKHLQDAPGRRIIFFDESLVGYVLHTSETKTDASTVYLNVSILPGDALDGAERGTTTEDESFATNFSIASTTLDATSMVVLGNYGPENTYYTVWKFEVPITYPRKKFSDPKILLSCFFGTEPDDSDKSETPTVTETVLPDLRPGHHRDLFLELNGLLVGDGGREFHLSSAFLERHLSEETIVESPRESHPEVTSSSDTLKATLSLPVTVSLVIKLKSTKPAGRNNVLLATLNIESSEELARIFQHHGSSQDYYFNILGLTMDFKFGTIHEYHAQDFPIRYRFMDSINLTYKLINNEVMDKEAEGGQTSKPININLILQVQRRALDTEKFENVSQIITTNWLPYLDFSINAPPINNSLKLSPFLQSQTTLQPPQQMLLSRTVLAINTRKLAVMNNVYKLKAAQRGPSTTAPAAVSLPIVSSHPSATRVASYSSSSVTVNLATNNNSTLSGLKLTFKGKLSIGLGEIISWKLQAINNSSTNKLNLSLIVQDPMTFSQAYGAGPGPGNNSSSNLLGGSGVENPTDVLVYSGTQLLQLYNGLKLATSGVIILNNDIRIGPIEANSVFETEIKLIGISKGIFNLDGIKIFDIGSGDGIDFGKLVEVFVV